MRNGFSLVELSIVLVILGLLTGGILGGQSLIRAAELRSVSTEYNRYIAAYYTFRDKYFMLPGDMTNATAFWGVAAGTTGTDNACYIAASTDARTCNGNGDGQITGPTTENSELFRYWQHLANAGLIEGTYRGTMGTNYGVTAFHRGTNSPSSRLGSTALWFTSYMAPFAGNTSNFAYVGGNYMRITLSGMTAEENWNLDVKMDDGLPQRGKMIGYKGDTTARCTTAWGQPSSADANATYNFTYTEKVCNPLYFF